MTKKVKKRYFVLMVFLVMMVLALTMGAFAFQNEPDGFRGLKWGDPPGKDMIFCWKDPINPDSLWYKRTLDKKKLGGRSYWRRYVMSSIKTNFFG